MNDTENTISPLDDAIVEDGIEENATLHELLMRRAAELSAERIVAFYTHLHYTAPSSITRQAELEITIAWVRAGMP